MELIPLEKRLVNDEAKAGAINKLPAVHKRHIKSFRPVQFYMPSIDDMMDADSVGLAEWQTAMEIYCQDLRWVLQQPYHKFWSFLLHASPTTQPLLTSFLMNSVKPFDPGYHAAISSPAVQRMLLEVHDAVLQVLMRLSVFKETKTDFITPAIWGSWLLDQHVLTIPTILELSSIFFCDNRPNPVLSKVIENVFSNEPRFSSQLVKIVNILLLKIEEPVSCFADKIRGLLTSDEKSLHFLEDLLLFQIDILFSLRCLLNHYAPASVILQDCDQLELRLAASYEQLVSVIREVHDDRRSSYASSLLDSYRINALEVFRKVIFTMKPEPTLAADRYFEVLMLCMEEKLFVYDFTKAYSFHDDADEFNKAGARMDDTRVQYMTDAISGCWSYYGSSFVADRTSEAAVPQWAQNATSTSASIPVAGVELDSLVTQVKDLLPDLPDHYIGSLLNHYNYNAETVINSVLENNVPAHLEKLKFESPPSFTQPNTLPKEKFHRGKHKNFERETVQDRKELKERIYDTLDVIYSQEAAQASTLADEMTGARGYVDPTLLPSHYGQDGYDDEYDDTYDDVGAALPESGDFVKPLNEKKAIREQEFSSEEEDESLKGRDLFVENPEVTRQRMEQRRAEKAIRKGHNPGVERNRDVVGKAKGQGQEKEVVLNRRHKTMYANQQRRRGADIKRKI